MSFNLSEKQKYHPRPNDYRNYYLELDVKEFIKKIIGGYDHSMSWDKFTDMVNHFAGEKLI